MSQAELAVSVRENTGKGAARKVRREGMVPAVVYGKNRDNVNLQIQELDLRKALGQGAARGLVRLVVDGQEPLAVLIQEVQTDPVRGDYYHIDFHEVALDEEVTTTVSITIVGESARANDGGIVNINARELEISCLPMEIPDTIEVDISPLGVGDSISAGELQREGITILDDPDHIVVSILLPSMEPVDKEAEDELEAEGEEAEAAAAEAPEEAE